jgi:membrane fusion protein (multidrug efflux system)
MREKWIALACTGMLAACSAGKPPPPKPPPQVGVLTLKSEPVTITTELPGRTVAYRIAEVRPQVSGVVQKRLFREGGDVTAGQQLYQIDPAPFKANLAGAEASLAHARASLVAARLLAQRYKPLAEAHAVSQQDYDNAVASQAQAEADVASGEAALETARINLTYTRVLSPISGRTGRSSVTEGALVASVQTAAMVVVQQLDPIYVDATQPSALLLRLRRELVDGRLKTRGDGDAETSLTLEDGSTYAAAGRLQFAEVTVDTGTGSVTLRAVFPNPKHLLLPGMFVHEHIDEGVSDAGLLVPQRAVSHNQRGESTTLVVGADNKVSTRIITADRAVGTSWLVSDGVTAGDRVVVTGLQRIEHGGGPVQPHEVTPAELAADEPGSAPQLP